MRAVVVMGVSGCGKSSVGAAIARRLGWLLVEGDRFHPPDNVAKMQAGIALDDGDRAGWLAALAAELQRHAGGAVLTCSALKRSYRDRLRRAGPELRFVHLQLSRELARGRVEQRAAGHYFPSSLVDSQFETLEDPRGEPGVLGVDAAAPLETVAEQAAAWIEASPP